MSEFCSAHQHHEPGCKQCEMAPRKIDIISNCFECSWYSIGGWCGKSQRMIEWTTEEKTGFPDWCPLKDYSNKWEETHEIFLHIGEALMSIGTKANMSQDWYAMVERLVDRGVEIAYRGKIEMSNTDDASTMRMHNKTYLTEPENLLIRSLYYDPQTPNTLPTGSDYVFPTLYPANAPIRLLNPEALDHAEQGTGRGNVCWHSSGYVVNELRTQ